MNGNIDRALTNVIQNWENEMDAPAEAARIVRKLRTDNYDELVQWLDAHAEKLMTDELRRRLQSFRISVRHQAGPESFKRWAKQAAEGRKLDPPTALSMPYACDSKGTWKKLGDMMKPDLLFAANSKEEAANTLRLDAAMLRMLAGRLKDGERVRDRFNDKDLPTAA